MPDFQFDATKYLARIKHTGSVDVSLDSLRSLQLAQLRSIPFENFDICLGKGIDLAPQACHHTQGTGSDAWPPAELHLDQLHTSWRVSESAVQVQLLRQDTVNEQTENGPPD